MRNDKRLLNRIDAAVSAITPDEGDALLREPIVRQTAHDFITAAKPAKKPAALRFVRAAASAAACFALLFGALTVFRTFYSVSSIVGIDVNPSVSLKVNSRDRVISAAANNADGAAILYGMDLARVDVVVAVNAIVGSMLRNGYLAGEGSAILVTVQSADAAHAAALENAITADLDGLFAQSEADPKVLHQSIDMAAAGDGEISAGKARLIELALENAPEYTYAELADMELDELYALAVSGVFAPDGTPGGAAAPGDTPAPAFTPSPAVTAPEATAGHAALISEAEACRIALARAGGGTVTECELETDDGAGVYDIELRFEGIAYECEVDAATGEVLSFDRD